MLSAIHPVRVARGVVGAAGTAVGLTEAVVRRTLYTAQLLRPHEQRGETAPAEGRAGRDEAAPWTATATADGSSADHAASDIGAGQEPEVVLPEPAPPAGPPVDVVGEALAAEAAAERGEGDFLAGMAHEPRGASRDEEHGDAALQRAEVDEIADEVAGELEDELAAVQAPQVADDSEEHLAEPVLDAAEARAVAEELKAAAEPDEG